MGGLLREIGDHVAVIAGEERIGGDAEAFGDALHLDIAVGVVVARERVLRVEPVDDLGQCQRRAELAQPPRDHDGHVGDAVGMQLRLEASAVVRRAAEVEDRAGGSGHVLLGSDLGERARRLRSRAAECGEQLRFLRLRNLQVPVLDVSVAANVLGNLR